MNGLDGYHHEFLCKYDVATARRERDEQRERAEAAEEALTKLHTLNGWLPVEMATQRAERAEARVAELEGGAMTPDEQRESDGLKSGGPAARVAIRALQAERDANFATAKAAGDRADAEWSRANRAAARVAELDKQWATACIRIEELEGALADSARAAEEMGALFPPQSSAAVILRGMVRKARAALAKGEP